MIAQLSRLSLCAVLVSALTVFSVKADESSGLGLLLNGIHFKQYIASIFVMPDELVSIQVSNSAQLPIEFASTDVRFLDISEGSWRMKAPTQPGLYRFTIHAVGPAKPVHVNVFVLTPMSSMQEGYIEGYRIDKYPTDTYKNMPKYLAPHGFVRVTEENVNMKVSPHFTLRQFLCKQKSGYPKFVVMQSTTLLMLEDLLDEVNNNGFDIDTFGFISGYRTPYYNRSIGNVKYSRHVFGDANDIFIDADKNGRMDDLNKDGKLTVDDVQILYNITSKFQDNSEGKYTGGVGKYRPKSHHGGFVHVDNRGYRARW